MDELNQIIGRLQKKCTVVEKMGRKWHGDYHFRVEIDQKTYFVRFLKADREFNVIPPVVLNNSMLFKQLTVGNCFVEHGIPFMKNCIEKKPYFEQIYINNTRYRITVFEGSIGNTIQCSNRKVVEQVVRILINIFEVNKCISTKSLCEINGKKEWEIRIANLQKSIYDKKLAKSLGEIGKNCLSKAFIDGEDKVVVHGDLNMQNILWVDEKIEKIIDYDSIGVTTPINEFSSIVKWYSKNENNDFDPQLFSYIIELYSKYQKLDSVQKEQLIGLVCLRCFFNNKSVKRMRQLQIEQQKEHLNMMTEEKRKMECCMKEVLENY